MDINNIAVLFVTANIGSVFEEPNVMLKIWTDEFLSTVSNLEPKFIALHCQEVGGKNYEKSMKYVEDFIKLLISANELKLFDRIRVYIDEDYSSAENFTALGSIYFIHESVQDVLIWDFEERKFCEVLGHEIYTGNIEAVSTKEKAKFPQNFFPECKWSRKGFLRTRWSLSGSVFDLINIHLFHDASNFVAMETAPSVYCKTRRRALEYTLSHLQADGVAVPAFLFGDFNFRADTNAVVKSLTEGLTSTKVFHHKNNECTKLQYHNEENEIILTVGKKEFKHSEHQTIFLNSDGSWLKTYDKEPEAFEKHLFEYPVNFPPSYPFEEKIACGSTYMQTRCPAWCDRVLLSNTAKKLVDDVFKIEYNIIGKDTCMGDHKPVCLFVRLNTNSGIIRCCLHNLTKCSCFETFANIEINITETDSTIIRRSSCLNIDKNLLHEPYTRDMLMHDPYTPESAESHSPLPTDKKLNENPDRKSVSPRILKSRLEIILRENDDSFNNLTKSQEGLNNKNVEPKNRNRCFSESAKRNTKIRLISTNSVHSVHRLQSHHSSSDEDWFEFEDKEDDIFEEISLKNESSDINKPNKKSTKCCCSIL